MLTATKQSKTGYWIEALKKSVYSIEEINYFLYNHINLVYRDFFSDALFDYIDKELEQQAMAEDLRKIADEGGNTGDFVKYILNESYYYNSRELADIAMIVAHIDTMSRAERVWIQTNSFYNSGNYNSALQCCFDILKHTDEDQAGDAFYGRVAYMVGSIYARMFMAKSADAYFSLAYDFSPEPKYAKACVYMSLISGDDEELLANIVKYRINDDALDSMKKRVQFTRHEIESTDETADFVREISEGANARDIVNEWKHEYYRMIK